MLFLVSLVLSPVWAEIIAETDGNLPLQDVSPRRVHFDKETYQDGPGYPKAKGSTRPYAKGFQNTLKYTKQLDQLRYELSERRERLGFMEDRILKTKENLAHTGLVGTLFGAKRALSRRLEHDEGQYVEQLHHFNARNMLYGDTLKKRDEIYENLKRHGESRQTRLAHLSQIALERGQEDASAAFRLKKNEVQKDLQAVKDFHEVTGKEHWSVYQAHKNYVESKSCSSSRSC